MVTTFGRVRAGQQFKLIDPKTQKPLPEPVAEKLEAGPRHELAQPNFSQPCGRRVLYGSLPAETLVELVR